MWKRIQLTGCLLAFCCVATASAQHAGVESGPRIEITQLMRAHPIGLAWWVHGGWRESLSDSSHLLLKGTYAEGGTKVMLSPASAHPGLYIKVMPITPLVLDIEAQQLRFFGLFGTVKEYPANQAHWGPDTRDGSITQGRHETGWRINAKATLQLKFGPAFLQFAYRSEWLWMNIDPTSRWYDPTTDLLYGRADRLDRTDATAGAFVVGEPGDERFVLIGAHWQGYWIRDTGVRRHILGGIVLTKPGWWSAQQFTLGLLAGYNAVDVYRKNEIYAGLIAKVAWDGLGRHRGVRPSTQTPR
ncbi:MAG: hypothetical protein VX589_02645 [Myxococcota bacterium]|nr:hypothetical protein [Myxococcota bacterium]